MSLWVFNASPLILLGKLGRLDWLPQLSPGYLIPMAVATEISAGPDNDVAKVWIVSAEAASHVVADTGAVPSILAWDLGAGETAVLCRVMTHSGTLAVLDDRAARTCAGVFEVPVIGTVGILLKANRQGLLSVVRPDLERLQAVGSLLSAGVIAEALHLAGEA